MKNIVQSMMISCRKASALADKQSLLSLTWRERISLKIHLSMCDFCTAYQKQSAFLDKLLHRHIHSDQWQSSPHMGNIELRARIIGSLDR